jgi:hypothetical protein
VSLDAQARRPIRADRQVSARLSRALYASGAAAVSHPVFYPKRRRSGVEMLYLLVTAAKWSSRPECVASLPSWSCGFDSRRPFR